MLGSHSCYSSRSSAGVGTFGLLCSIIGQVTAPIFPCTCYATSSKEFPPAMPSDLQQGTGAAESKYGDFSELEAETSVGTKSPQRLRLKNRAKTEKTKAAKSSAKTAIKKQKRSAKSK
jgi:hypothetical protein